MPQFGGGGNFTEKLNQSLRTLFFPRDNIKNELLGVPLPHSWEVRIIVHGLVANGILDML